jgi:hypothetical protein
MLIEVLRKINIDPESILGSDYTNNKEKRMNSDIVDLLFGDINSQSTENSEKEIDFKSSYNNLWAQNNSKLSLQYLGVGTSNYDINLIPDQLKQYLIDLLLIDQPGYSPRKFNLYNYRLFRKYNRIKSRKTFSM